MIQTPADGATASRNAFRVNQGIETPVGRGVVQAGFSDGRLLIRVPIGGSIHDRRCITPHAVQSSLWEFGPEECKSISARK
jgi:hypothetical protein